MLELNTISAVHVDTSVVVVDYNFELADMGNPNGAIYGFTAFMVAIAEDGRRWQHNHRWKSSSELDAISEAQEYANRVNEKLARGRKLSEECWDEVEPVYGSKSYRQQNIESQRFFAEREEAFH